MWMFKINIYDHIEHSKQGIPINTSRVGSNNTRP